VAGVNDPILRKRAFCVGRRFVQSWGERYILVVPSGGIEMIVTKAKVLDPTHLELSRPIGMGQGETVVVSIASPSEIDPEH